MKKVLVVFGTRPEAIKMCPVVLELSKREKFEVCVCVSGQHKQMLNQVLSVFGVKADYDLQIMSKGQTLFDITSKVLKGISLVLEKCAPDIVLVHGDTSTAFAASLAAFYRGIPIGHVEAGLRSGDIGEPFPEEFNRRAITLMSRLDFAPTQLSKELLINEGKENVFLTGNTVLDSFKYTLSKTYESPFLPLLKQKKVILFTMHRRENIGEPMKSVFSAVRRVAGEREDICFLFPLHPNPKIRSIAKECLGNCMNVKTCEPLDVVDFHNILSRCYFALSDSGGVQEEGVALHKPVLVLRNKTERPEGLACGGLRLIGTDKVEVYKNILLLLDDNEVYKQMSQAVNPFGDGNASEKIVDIIEKEL